MLWGRIRSDKGRIRKMNAVIDNNFVIMEVLTIIATLFIPLSFIVGLYGMNFKYMPELDWRWGYPGVWLVIIAVIAGFIGYFKYKKWI